MGDRLATIDISRKVDGAVPLFVGGELGPHLTQCFLGRVASAKWYPDPSSRLPTIDVGRGLRTQA